MAKSGITWASKSKFQRRCWISAFDEGLWWLWILKIYSFDSPSVAEEFLEEGWNFEQHQVRSETRYHWFPGMWFTRTSRKANAPSSGFQVWRCSRKLEMSLVFCAERFETFQNKSIDLKEMIRTSWFLQEDGKKSGCNHFEGSHLFWNPFSSQCLNHLCCHVFLGAKMSTQ